MQSHPSRMNDDDGDDDVYSLSVSRSMSHNNVYMGLTFFGRPFAVLDFLLYCTIILIQCSGAHSDFDYLDETKWFIVRFALYVTEAGLRSLYHYDPHPSARHWKVPSYNYNQFCFALFANFAADVIAVVLMIIKLSNNGTKTNILKTVHIIFAFLCTTTKIITSAFRTPVSVKK